MQNNLKMLLDREYPEIDCVIIGVNVERTLESCILSVLGADYPASRLNVIYVDGGSGDGSIAVAEQFKSVRIISLGLKHPTPGRGRNAGWRAGNAPFVMFLDADTMLEKGWLKTAVIRFGNDACAIYGKRNERNSDKSIFNWIGDLEWDSPDADAESFGGDVMVRRDALEKTGGYDDSLIAGEDPDLAHRMKNKGWSIIGLDVPMTRHDLNMTSIVQYLKRAYRSGHAFAEIRRRHMLDGRGFFSADITRIVARGGGGILLLLCGFIQPWLFAAGLVLICLPLFRIRKFQKLHSLEAAQGAVYAVHAAFVVIPQFVGVLRYMAGILLNTPLRNHGGGTVK